LPALNADEVCCYLVVCACKCTHFYSQQQTAARLIPAAGQVEGGVCGASKGVGSGSRGITSDTSASPHVVRGNNPPRGRGGRTIAIERSTLNADEVCCYLVVCACKCPHFFSQQPAARLLPAAGQVEGGVCGASKGVGSGSRSKDMTTEWNDFVANSSAMESVSLFQQQQQQQNVFALAGSPASFLSPALAFANGSAMLMSSGVFVCVCV
jgi:membrane protease subunit (stomatin/prohibitin family)